MDKKLKEERFDLIGRITWTLVNEYRSNLQRMRRDTLFTRIFSIINCLYDSKNRFPYICYV